MVAATAASCDARLRAWRKALARQSQAAAIMTVCPFPTDLTDDTSLNRCGRRWIVCACHGDGACALWLSAGSASQLVEAAAARLPKVAVGQGTGVADAQARGRQGWRAAAGQRCIGAGEHRLSRTAGSAQRTFHPCIPVQQGRLKCGLPVLRHSGLSEAARAHATATWRIAHTVQQVTSLTTQAPNQLPGMAAEVLA